MNTTRHGALILAAGKGTRMHSSRPKVLQTLLGEPMLAHMIGALRPIFRDELRVVVGHGADRIRAAFADENLHYIEQTKQLGTGHALATALPELKAAGLERVLVVNGDMPLLTTRLVETFLRDAQGADMALATLNLADPGAYGRVVRHQGRVTAVVEARDYDPSLHGPEPHEVNVGLYLFKLDVLEDLLPQLSDANGNGEYYITDLAALAVARRLVVTGLECGSDPNLLGVNTPAELARSEALLRQRITTAHLDAGVIMHMPESVVVGPFVTLEPGAEVYGPCELYGTTHVASGATVGSHCVLRNTRVGADTLIRPFSHLEDADVGADCRVGPYARLRPGAVLEETARVGNFVEMKKARLGRGAKAGHLTYLGDADIGAEANIGAGTITCNYDGRLKHRTVIGEKAFVGSNTALVAPVTVGAKALIGAGSVITRDVPDDALAIARERQRNLEKRKNG